MDPYKYLIELVLGLLICLFFTYIGYSYEHTKFNQFKVEVTAAGEKQAVESIQTDKENKQHELQTQTDSTNAIASITSYYKLHPVRVCGNTGSSTVSSPAFDTKRADGTSTISYASPYNPEDVELVAARLQALQTLLKEDGVIFDANN